MRSLFPALYYRSSRLPHLSAHSEISFLCKQPLLRLFSIQSVRLDDSSSSEAIAIPVPADTRPPLHKISPHSTTINMDAIVIFHGTATLPSFQDFSARDPRYSGCNIYFTPRQQEYESYKAEYIKALLHMMVARCPHLGYQQARSQFDLMRAQGKLECLGVKPQYRSLVPAFQTSHSAVQPSGGVVPVQANAVGTQVTNAAMQTAHVATESSRRDVVTRGGSQDQSTITMPAGTVSPKTSGHGAPREHDTRSLSVGGSSALESSSVEEASNRRHSADEQYFSRS